MLPPRRAQTLLAAGLVTALGAGVAFATTVGNPRAEAKALIAQLEANPTDKKLAAEPLAHARSALARANGARSAGDVAHGEELDGLALEWAEAGRDVVRAAAVEQQAAKLQKQAADTARKAVRAQALLEVTLARRGKAKAKLKQLQQAASSGEASHGGKKKEEHHRREHKPHHKRAGSGGKP